MRGSILKRGRRWASVVDLGRDPQTGKRRQKWYSHDKREDAEVHLAQILSSLQGGTYIPPTKLTFGEFLTQWLRDYAETHVGPITFRDYRQIVRGHLQPTLGRLPLVAVSARDIDGYCAEKLRGGKAPGTVRKHFEVIHETLAQAVKWGLLVKNVADMASKPKPRERDVRPWDEEELRLFLGTARRESSYFALYAFLIYTGARIGEALGLQWSDVDFTAGTATIRRKFYRLGGSKKDKEPTRLLFAEPKTKSSRRVIHLPPVLIEELRTLRETQKEHRRLLGTDHQGGELVFCQPTGAPLHLGNLRRRDFAHVLKEAKLKPARLHDLRHLHASYLALAGVPVRVAQERLGHSNPNTTLRIYTHILAGQDEAAARAVQDRILGSFVSSH